MSNKIILELIICSLCGIFYGAAIGERKRNYKRYRDEQRELAKWETELERKASRLHSHDE